MRVDGNDILAVIATTREAVARAPRRNRRVGAVTFRMGGHSSSDDPTRYRDANRRRMGRRDPVARFRAYLRGVGLLTDDEKRWTDELNEEIGRAIQEAEAMPPPPIESLFSDVYAKMPRHIEEQMRYAIAMGEGTKFEGAFPL